MGDSKKVVSSRVLLSVNDNSLELQQWFLIHDFWCLERLQLPSLTVPAAYITLENEGLSDYGNFKGLHETFELSISLLIMSLCPRWDTSIQRKLLHSRFTQKGNT